MKTLYIASTIALLTSVLSATELSWVDEQIEAIKPPRKGANINSIANPFIFLEKNGYIKKVPKKDTSKSATVKSSTNASKISLDEVEQKKKYTKLTLELIINSSAMINGVWYKKNSKVNDYTLVDINKDSITLKQGDKKLILSTRTKNKSLKFKNK